MVIKENKLDNLIQKLQSTNPELLDSELLTDSIMLKIKDKSKNRKPTVLMWVRTLSTSAAILLVGLFCFQQNESVSFTSYKQTNNFNLKINIDSICLQNQHTSGANLLAIYMCHLNQNSIKNKIYKSFDQQLKK